MLKTVRYAGPVAPARVMACAIACTIACVIALTGCGRSDDGGPVSSLGDDTGILGFVPADTPYVFATPARMPDDVLDKLEASADSLYSAYETVIRESMAEAARDLEEQGDAEQARLVMSLAGEIAGMLQSENLRAAGVPRGPQIAFYGVGLLPVLRVELDNPVAFEARIAELEANAGQAMAKGEVDGVAYRYLGDDDARLLLAVLDDYAVMAIAPSRLSDTQLANLLGIEAPGRNIAEAGLLGDLAADYGFTAYGLGYIDVERLARTFLDGPTGIDAELMGLMDYAPDELSDVCREELRAMAGLFPRMVAGYTEVSTSVLNSNTVVELREDIATALSALAAPVPGLGLDHGGLGSFGVSFDIREVRAFVETRLDELEASPLECEYFGDMRAGVEQARQSLNQPVLPIVYDLRGFLAVVDRIEGLDLKGQQPPKDVDARVLVAIDNAEGLLAMGAMFSPELASLDLQPDGEPVELAVPQIVNQFDKAYVAMTPGALAISVGNASPDGLADLLASSSADPMPSLSMRLDGKRYYEFMNEAVRVGAETEGEELPEEVRDAMSQVMTGVGDMIDRIAVDVSLTPRGIEMPTRVTLAE